MIQRILLATDGSAWRRDPEGCEARLLFGAGGSVRQRQVHR